LAGAAGLAVGLVGAVAFGASAQATIEQEPLVDIKVSSTCEEISFVIDYSSEGDGDIELKIKAGPAIETVTIEPGETHHASFFPRVSYEIFIDGELVKTGAWEDPSHCGEATVAVKWELDCDSISLEVTAPRTFEVVLITREDDENFLIDPEPGATITTTILNATEDTVVVITYDGEVVETIAWEQPDGCEEEDGSAEELAATGSPTLWIAGVAIALLAVGGSLYLLARRRGVGFTA
jgi:hypothetical protein